jgi:hypothetical protein
VNKRRRYKAKARRAVRKWTRIRFDALGARGGGYGAWRKAVLKLRELEAA